MYVSTSGWYDFVFGHEVSRVSGIWEMFLKLNTAEVDGTSKDVLISSLVQSGLNRGNVSCFEALLPQKASFEGTISAKGGIRLTWCLNIGDSALLLVQERIVLVDDDENFEVGKTQRPGRRGIMIYSAQQCQWVNRLCASGDG